MTFWFKVFIACLASIGLGVGASAALVCYKLNSPDFKTVSLFCVVQLFWMVYTLAGLRGFSGGKQ